jgi:hypothetical protein
LGGAVFVPSERSRFSCDFLRVEGNRVNKMEIQDRYEVKFKDLTIVYKLKDQIEDLEIGDRVTKITEDKKMSDKDKRIAVFDIMLEDLISVDGLERNGKPVTMEEIKSLRIPAAFIDMLTKAYVGHKKELATGISTEDEAKNV